MSVLVVLMALWSSVQQPTGSLLRLDRVEIAGAKRYSSADVLRISGLQQGQALTEDDVRRAGGRMVETGFFKSVRYRYEPLDGVVRVTLEIEEEIWSVPVVFDNFVWLTDDAIVAALRPEVPAFNGTAPANDSAAAYIGRALQRLIDARRIAGQVQVTDRINARTGSRQWVYRVSAAGLQSCAFHVPGAAAVFERLLLQAARDDIIGKDYSRAFTIDFAEGTLRQIYLKRGHLRAAFGVPSASMATACNGVAITLLVSEGVAYRWLQAEWIGMTAMAGKDLDGLLGMKRGEVADLTKIDTGLAAVQRTYDKIGYLERRLNVVPRFNDAERTVVFAVTIVEGPQYRMGALDFVGFAAPDVASLSKKWRLQAGAIFDGTYPAEFQRDELRRVGSPVLLERRVNAETRRVDVKFTMK